ncbi:glycosyltransferase family 4 protein [Caulobacter soli]|uniref:glycosyltransferase family 4 protein n=1 Tax=Caulobacter soli TaxID=2708539 RepID=UPI001FE38734|nr:glycosyltransferase family 1 protein [Caulobacter soli]
MDIAGMLSRWRQPTPTGIDRVEMAYAQALAERAPDRLGFAGFHPGLGYARFPVAAVSDYLAATREAWAGGAAEEVAEVRRRAMLRAMLGARPVFDAPSGAGRVYLHLSPRGLERRRVYEGALRRERARLVAFVHDVIPIERPEFVADGGASRFERRLTTLVDLADGVLVNSHATAAALAPHLARAGRRPEVRVAPLGLPTPPPPPAAVPAKPYFVVLGAIEPRKNHLLLLHIWRRWAERDGVAATPTLVIVGARGWENENILDLLDRSPVLAGVVEERGGLGDEAVRALIGGARAVLCPSFAEGYGLPVAEALGLGAPVLASDIPAHREVGGRAADYLDPLDGPAWAAAVRDYAQPWSEPRRRQLERLATWRRPGWDDHFRVAFDLIEEVAR